MLVRSAHKSQSVGLIVSSFDSCLSHKKKIIMDYKIVKSGTDIHIHLGVMRNAVIIRKFSSGYGISEGSFFPFKREMYRIRFNSDEDAVKVASNYFMIWFSQTMEFLSGENKLKNIVDKNYLE